MSKQKLSQLSTFSIPRRRSRISRFLGLLLLGAGMAFLSTCSKFASPDSQWTRPQAASAKVVVGVTTAQRKDLTRKIILPGTLVAFREATLYGKITGYLRSISVDKGDSVRRGQRLAVLEVPEMTKEIDQAEAAYQEALASLNRSKAEADLQSATYRRYKEVRDKDPGAISNQELDEFRSKFEVAETSVKLAEATVATARARRDRLIAMYRYTEITAPFSGVVTARFVDPGALIQAGTSSSQQQEIVTLQDLDTIRVYVSVAEIDVPMIRIGTPASLTTAAYPGKAFIAAVTRFAEALDPSTRTMKTEIDVRNPRHALRPGMYAEVTLELEKLRNVLIIPDSALAVDGSKEFVWVVRETMPQRVLVETGLDDGTQVEIRSGLSGGEQVVVAGKEGLSEGRPVQASNATAQKP